MAEIIGVSDGGSIFLYGIEYGLIKIKMVDGEGGTREEEFYCSAEKKSRFIKTLSDIFIKDWNYDRAEQVAP